MLLYPHIGINEKGHLTLGGLDCIELAAEYGTPLYLLDVDAVRSHCRDYMCALKDNFFGHGCVAYASKALCFAGIYRVISEEGMYADCVSGGELYTALRGGFPAEKIFFHGNLKTRREIGEALDAGVGYVVVDSEEELDLLENEAALRQKTVGILLRITPGIDPHTHRYVTTGTVDSKFGSAISTGRADEMIAVALKKAHLRLEGFHCHVGSQIFGHEPFVAEAERLASFSAESVRKYGIKVNVLDLGGGIGVRYTENDPEVNVGAVVKLMADAVKKSFGAYGLPVPRIVLEPGRSIVADAGVTLYTVGSVKRIPGVRTYVSVDGGMTDDPRYALYSSRYTAVIADRAGDDASDTVTVAGRCCESGDLLGEDMKLQSPQVGNILAFLTTGAYNYSMASNYNRLPRPPIVTVEGGSARLAVRRENYEDLVSNDII